METPEKDEFVKSSYILMTGYIISSLLSAVGTIVMIRLITVYENSLLNIAYVIPAIIITAAELGLNYASTHFIAENIKKNNFQEISSIIKTNLIIKLFIGLIAILFLNLYASFITYNIYRVNDEQLVMLVQISSFGICANILYEALNSIFLGKLNFKMVQIGTIIHTLLRSTISIFLILLGFHLLGPIIGLVFSLLFVDLIYIIFLLKDKKKSKIEKTPLNLKTFSRMMKYGYPLLIFSIFLSFKVQIFFFILIFYGFINEVSYFDVAIVSASLLGIFTKSISFTLFPIFSKKSWDNQDERMKLIKTFQFSIKFGSLIILPTTILLMVFSRDIFPLIYGEQYLDASIYISVYLISYLFVFLGSLSIPAFFNGQKKTINVLYIELVYLIGSLFFVLILINIYGGIGLVVGIVLGSFISVLYANLSLRKKYGKILFNEFKQNFCFLILAIFCGITTFCANIFLKNLIPIDNLFVRLLILLICFLIYCIQYLIFVGLFSLITIEEVDFMVNSLEKFPIINKIIKILAGFEKKLILINILRRK